jgi:hypothetical protein
VLQPGLMIFWTHWAAASKRNPQCVSLSFGVDPPVRIGQLGERANEGNLGADERTNVRR